MNACVQAGLLVLELVQTDTLTFSLEEFWTLLASQDEKTAKPAEDQLGQAGRPA